MTTPQPGLFVEGTTAHYALEFGLNAETSAADLRGALRCTRSARVVGVETVFAFSLTAWRMLSDQAPAGLRDFTGLGAAPGPVAPATQRDILVWAHGGNLDDMFDAVRGIARALAPVAAMTLDLRGFTYRDSRDLTGFIDGTANPKGGDRRDVALIADGPGAGGAYVVSQQWIHDLDRFGALDVADQERVIGRTKPDSIELQGDAMPPDSHVSRTDAKVDGVAQKLYRRSFPYGSVAEHGLYFLAFACDLERFDVLLRRMYGVWHDGLSDRLTDFSRAVTGSYWFAPSLDSLGAALD